MGRANGQDPKLGKTLEQFFRARRKRLDAEKVVTKLAAVETELKEACKQALLQENLEQSRCRFGTFGIEKVSVFQVENWDSFWKWLVRMKVPQVLYQRINNASLSEVLDQHPVLRKRGVPGGQFVEVYKVNVSARG